MNNTKERILETALILFAKDGYTAVSVSMIAGKLGMTKGALYKHYQNKQDIFDHIVKRMEEKDTVQANKGNVPADSIDLTTTQSVTVKDVCNYSKEMFYYWTEDAFASNFRKMLTLEQYRNPKMAQLFNQYLSAGPVSYLTELFEAILKLSKQEAKRKAVELYAPMFLYYSIYDDTNEKEDVKVYISHYIDDLMHHLIRSVNEYKRLED
ncbi:TetR/AcrR family transcriptional regulator [Anaerosporobacter faecicola]|uniref:TetR/AcrR family transcriptional regulator n=1 Tax=Anaerosporobacter faecicola TaxID=2718714 RepID=UPI00143A98E8|nr:TetR/AcrR family transcriptional regulator [Anaerosporobacter faecicola]